MAVWQDFYVLPLLCKNLNDAAFKDSYPHLLAMLRPEGKFRGVFLRHPNARESETFHRRLVRFRPLVLTHLMQITTKVDLFPLSMRKPCLRLQHQALQTGQLQTRVPCLHTTAISYIVNGLLGVEAALPSILLILLGVGG